MRFLSKKTYLLFFQMLVFSALLFQFGCATMNSSTSAAEVYVDTFRYESLDDYGEWNLHGRFGRVWHPYVAPNWRPYYYGHWAWSMEGWLWMSYEPFGWITFHHGYWYLDPYFGWVWIPGQRWFPAVVMWMQFDDHVGWAPLQPPGVVIEEPWGHRRVNIWNFVEIRYFQKEYIGNYVIRTPLQRPHPVNVIKKAPDVRVIEKITKTRITPVPIEKKIIELEKKTYQRMLVPKGEAEKIKRHEPDAKNALKPRPAAKKPPVAEKKPPAAVKKPPVKKPKPPDQE